MTTATRCSSRACTGWRWPRVVDKVEHRPLDYAKVWRETNAALDELGLNTDAELFEQIGLGERLAQPRGGLAMPHLLQAAVGALESIERPVARGLRSATIDLGLLALFNVLFFCGGFVAFLRYAYRTAPQAVAAAPSPTPLPTETPTPTATATTIPPTPTVTSPPAPASSPSSTAARATSRTS